MAEISVSHATTSTSNSPPPNCAICLGTCTNKCFSDSCMHQFCFTCLLEWSKVKAECPLCKQTFTSIIHNVKSNEEYDEHFIEPNIPREEVLDENDFLYLPTAQPSRHFQFRTTFTVDPRGELAIQQMLLTHSRLNSVYMPNYNHRHRHRRDVSSTNYRRMIYARNMWVTAPPDITGRYRDVSPHFFRENPAAINRLVPWLNRELNALLEEHTQQVMLLVDIILSHLNRHHIRGFFFKNLLREYLGTRTEHFIHEFFNYMKSPYDMVGYDRHAFYTARSAFVQTIPSEDSSSSTDSDITVVATTSAPTTLSNTDPNPNPFHRPTIEVIEINSDSSRDSDVVIQEPTPPVVVDLVNTSDGDDDVRSVQQTVAQNETKLESTSSESDVKPKYNLMSKKAKRKAEKYEIIRKKRKSKSKYIISSPSSSDTSDSSSDSENYKYYKRKRKQKPKKSSRARYISSSSISDTTDDEPLVEKLKKLTESNSYKSKRRERDRIKKYYKYKKQSSSDESDRIESNRKYIFNPPSIKIDVPSMNNIPNNYQDEQRYDSDKPLDYSMAGFAGPSYHSSNMPKIKKEKCTLWYSRPRVYDSDSSIDN